MPINDHKKHVQTVYTEVQVSLHVHAQKDAGMSLRQIANIYGRPITHADIQRILLGIFPVSVKKRLVLRIPPVCAKCDQPLPKPKRQVPEWLEEAVQNLRKLETAANVPPDENRVYARGGKRVNYPQSGQAVSLVNSESSIK